VNHLHSKCSKTRPPQAFPFASTQGASSLDELWRSLDSLSTHTHPLSIGARSHTHRTVNSVRSKHQAAGRKAHAARATHCTLDISAHTGAHTQHRRAHTTRAPPPVRTLPRTRTAALCIRIRPPTRDSPTLPTRLSNGPRSCISLAQLLVVAPARARRPHVSSRCMMPTPHPDAISHARVGCAAGPPAVRCLSSLPPISCSGRRMACPAHHAQQHSQTHHARHRRNSHFMQPPTQPARHRAARVQPPPLASVSRARRVNGRNAWSVGGRGCDCRAMPPVPSAVSDARAIHECATPLRTPPW